MVGLVVYVQCVCTVLQCHIPNVVHYDPELPACVVVDQLVLPERVVVGIGSDSVGSGRVVIDPVVGSVEVFRWSSAKTTTSLHLAHYLGLHGYRVLAIDLDPQASLSAMFGAQPEIDVGENETVYAALRHDADNIALRRVP